MKKVLFATLLAVIFAAVPVTNKYNLGGTGTLAELGPMPTCPPSGPNGSIPRCQHK